MAQGIARISDKAWGLLPTTSDDNCYQGYLLSEPSVVDRSGKLLGAVETANFNFALVDDRRRSSRKSCVTSTLARRQWGGGYFGQRMYAGYVTACANVMLAVGWGANLDSARLDFEKWFLQIVVDDCRLRTHNYLCAWTGLYTPQYMPPPASLTPYKYWPVSALTLLRTVELAVIY